MYNVIHTESVRGPFKKQYEYPKPPYESELQDVINFSKSPSIAHSTPIENKPNKLLINTSSRFISLEDHHKQTLDTKKQDSQIFNQTYCKNSYHNGFQNDNLGNLENNTKEKNTLNKNFEIPAKKMKQFTFKLNKNTSNLENNSLPRNNTQEDLIVIRDKSQMNKKLHESLKRQVSENVFTKTNFTSLFVRSPDYLTVNNFFDRNHVQVKNFGKKEIQLSELHKKDIPIEKKKFRTISQNMTTTSMHQHKKNQISFPTKKGLFNVNHDAFKNLIHLGYQKQFNENNDGTNEATNIHRNNQSIFSNIKDKNFYKKNEIQDKNDNFLKKTLLDKKMNYISPLPRNLSRRNLTSSGSFIVDSDKKINGHKKYPSIKLFDNHKYETSNNGNFNLAIKKSKFGTENSVYETSNFSLGSKKLEQIYASEKLNKDDQLNFTYKPNLTKSEIYDHTKEHFSEAYKHIEKNLSKTQQNKNNNNSFFMHKNKLSSYYSPKNDPVVKFGEGLFNVVKKSKLEKDLLIRFKKIS